MLKEMGLGLVLMLAGDGDMARRAGDALIQDQIDDAIEEGGFSAVRFGNWEKGFDGGRFWLGFSGVEVTRDGAELAADGAVIYPVSVAMRFEQGAVTMLEAGDRWTFSGVEIDGAWSLFKRSVSVRGEGLAFADRSGRFSTPFCLFGQQCADPVSFDGERLESFGLVMTRSGTRASFRFAWREAGECMLMDATDFLIPRGEPLSMVGRGLLDGSYDGDVRMTRGDCGQPTGMLDVEGGRVIIDAAPHQQARWSSRDRRLDGMLAVLMVTVTEAYEYLVE